MRTGKLFLALALSLTACVNEEPDLEDAERDQLGGKFDTVGISENTPEAWGVLRVANELGAYPLRYDAELSQKATDNIVAYRLGDDEEAGTSDDQRFDSLAELDNLPFVGPIAFGKLLSYARAHGYIYGVDAGWSRDGGWPQDGGGWPQDAGWSWDAGGSRDAGF